MRPGPHERGASLPVQGGPEADSHRRPPRAVWELPRDRGMGNWGRRDQGDWCVSPPGLLCGLSRVSTSCPARGTLQLQGCILFRGSSCAGRQRRVHPSGQQGNGAIPPLSGLSFTITVKISVRCELISECLQCRYNPGSLTQQPSFKRKNKSA